MHFLIVQLNMLSSQVEIGKLSTRLASYNFLLHYQIECTSDGFIKISFKLFKIGFIFSPCDMKNIIK